MLVPRIPEEVSALCEINITLPKEVSSLMSVLCITLPCSGFALWLSPLLP